MKNTIFLPLKESLDDFYSNLIDSYTLFLKIGDKTHEEGIYTLNSKNIKKEKEFLKLVYPLLKTSKNKPKDYKKTFYENEAQKINLFCTHHAVLFNTQKTPLNLGKSVIFNIKTGKILYLRTAPYPKVSFWVSIDELLNNNKFTPEIKNTLFINYEKELLNETLTSDKMKNDKKVKL